MSSFDYFRIRLSTVRAFEELPFDIYLQLDGKIITYLRMGESLTDTKITHLHNKDTGESFFVHNQHKQIYRDYVKSSMNSDKISNDEKAVILRESSIAILEDLFETPDVARALEEAKPIITDLLSFMDNAPESIGNLISLTGHDFYTYNHSFDVSIYSLGLGQVLGMDKVTLEELGQSSLFHDIGKRNVPLEILCKKGALSEDEWFEMRQHPAYGLKILNAHENISDAVKAACYEHHESWTGGGYPQDISGHEIHPFGRIVALTDTYDAMTTQRSYNTPLKPTEALNMMKDKISGRFDPDMLNAMYSILFKMEKDQAS
ncbi:HD-GYP domain-containing protein [Pseudobdellovibrio exovorus]|uniref:HD-GYP hydrolase domain-containing protein n=1 Tax=Pseudobdellovibrio exovorus JSS TaxID=1184267 RepID=M4VB42_9BACT|nr:HD domain-containing phosphohydrolase [Pseudobdellovibrio exovorus]AGH95241.1 HD-GYP hydrolase domain-containing protein [Pseudobdellovibrio exovorus JSS]